MHTWTVAALNNPTVSGGYIIYKITDIHYISEAFSHRGFDRIVLILILSAADYEYQHRKLSGVDSNKTISQRIRIIIMPET